MIFRNHVRRVTEVGAAKRAHDFWSVVFWVFTVPSAYLATYILGWFQGTQVHAPIEAVLTHPALSRPLFPQFAWTNLGLLALIAVYLAVAVVISLAQRLRVLYKHRRADLAAEALYRQIAEGGSCDTPFVLYLRPFGSTDAFRTRIKENRRSKANIVEFEAVLTASAKPLPLLALGESLEHLGAARIKTTDEEWKLVAERLMECAELIVILPSSRPGTLWEVEQLLARNWIAKSVIIDAPDKSRTEFSQEAEWSEIGALLARAGYTLPANDRKGRIMFFGAAKQPQLNERLDFRRPGPMRKFLARARGLKPAGDRLAAAA